MCFLMGVHCGPLEARDVISSLITSGIGWTCIPSQSKCGQIFLHIRLGTPTRAPGMRGTVSQVKLTVSLDLALQFLTEEDT